MLDALELAMVQAASLNNWDAVERIRKLATDPVEVERVTGESVKAFVQWKLGTSLTTGESGYISDGGAFRKEAPSPSSGQQIDTSPQRVKAAQESLTKDALDSLPPAVKNNPTVFGKVKDAALTAAAHVFTTLARLDPHVSKAMEVFFNVADDPRTDFGKFGYNPTFGSGGHGGNDPVQAQLGISAHLAATIASKVLGTALYHFRKRVMGHFKGADSADWIDGAVTGLVELFDGINQAFGLSPVDPSAIKAALEKMVTQKKFADSAPLVRAKPANPPVVQTAGAPAKSEVALAGEDGAKVAKLLGQSKAYGVRVMADIVGDAVRRYKNRGPLLTTSEVKKLADSFAAVNSTADLLARFRVRERANRARVFKGNHHSPDIPFQSFTETIPGVIATPKAAVDYFLSLTPEMGIDPDRYGDMQRRRAFTLAESTNGTLTAKIQQIIAYALRNNKSVADAMSDLETAMNKAGVSPANPQYSEMVYRTNAMDSFVQGTYEEGRHPDVEGIFPVWNYLGIADGREGRDHRPKFNKYYPQAATFSDVRGPRPFNCRCCLKWVDKYEWEDLSSKGFEVESNW